MSDMPSFKGGQSTHTASCVFPYMSLHVTCPLCVVIPSMTPIRDSLLPSILETKPAGCQQIYATELHMHEASLLAVKHKQSFTMHVSPLKAIGTVYQTQSQGYENTTYQACSQGYEKLLHLVAQTLV